MRTVPSTVAAYAPTRYLKSDYTHITHIHSMKKLILSIGLSACAAAAASAWDTPTMGWSSWNAFGHRINEEIIRSQADAMVSPGLSKAG